MAPQQPIGSLLIKPAGPDCNLRCEYCFYLRKADLFEGARHRMSDEVLELTTRKALEDGGPQVSFGWQGGEPTLMGLDFFKRAMELQRKYRRRGQQVMNGLQTNGFVIDEAWCDLLRENQFLVGLSLDGPEHVHDRYRKTADGRGSFERIKAVAELMLSSRVEVNALIVVNDYSAKHAREIYDFHRGIGFRHMQFIPCVEPCETCPGGVAPFSVSGKAYGAFLCDLADRWMEDFEHGWPTIYLRHFESLLHIYCGVPAPDCVLSPVCGPYVVVEHNGDVYSCDFFVTPETRLGHVSGGGLADMLNSPQQRAFGRRKAEMPGACNACEWVKQCFGGCLKDRLAGVMRDGRSALCVGYQMFFEHIDKPFRKLADRWLRRQQRRQAAQSQQQPPTQSRPAPGRNAPCPCGSGRKFKDCCATKPQRR